MTDMLIITYNVGETLVQVNAFAFLLNTGLTCINDLTTTSLPAVDCNQYRFCLCSETDASVCIRTITTSASS